ncbi:LysR substrate-binding domain-containing protein [Trinickia dinghuensis]|uniref:LysR family transcriptional regulator n=1 Tax=Trinickia dinghuensis TaxID=2291023 RepID=A0A3D8JWV8_9BURK|nr:LysR substrate-binding domain-containing protein [Trinickia dinghuensis]RDU97282.1 LysR family transcriptional regulator [Trinickia dinghuensis]
MAAASPAPPQAPLDRTAIESYFSRQLKLRHLQLLVALADRQTVAKVASALSVTQPAVSKMLGEMEKGIGIPLFERDGRRIRPTAHGECLIRHARELLLLAQRASEELHAMSAGTGGRVEVGVLSVAAPILIPAAVALFKQRSPTATVCLHEGTLDQLVPALRAGQLDMIVGRLARGLAAPEFTSEALFDDPTVIVVARTHPLARRKRIKWADLTGLAWIVPSAGAPMHRHLLSVLETHGVGTPINTVESVVIDANVSMLQAYPMLGLLPRSHARHQEEVGTLKILPLSLGAPLGPVSTTWRIDAEDTPAAALFRACLSDAAKAAHR